MKLWAWASFLGVCVVATHAQADSYSFGGESGRIRVEVLRLGFNEGAGIGGWSVESARDFVGFARQLERVVPRDTRVRVAENLDETGVVIALVRRGRTSRLKNQLTHVDYDEIVTLLSDHFDVESRPVRRSVALFTIQVFASRSLARAERFAATLDASGVRPARQVFHEACHPCSIPEARVLESPHVSRVVVGVYDRRATAERARAELARKAKLAGFVRPL